MIILIVIGFYICACMPLLDQCKRKAYLLNFFPTPANLFACIRVIAGDELYSLDVDSLGQLRIWVIFSSQVDASRKWWAACCQRRKPKARQVIVNSCATQAILSILIYRSEICMGPELANLKDMSFRTWYEGTGHQQHWIHPGRPQQLWKARAICFRWAKSRHQGRQRLPLHLIR